MAVKEYQFTILNRVMRVSFNVKMIFEQRLDGVEGIGFVDLKERFFSRDEYLEQSPYEEEYHVCYKKVFCKVGQDNGSRR